MELRFSEADEEFRQTARTWLEANVPDPPLPSGDTAEGFALHLDWEHKLFDARWAVVSWPEEYGGRGASIWQWLIFEEEYYRAGAPQRVTQNGIFLLAPTVFEFGTQEQRDRVLPRMAAAQDLWAQGWSEPGAGSDLAALTSKAERDDARGGWVLNGQKTWSTRGAFCTHLFGMFRTDPEQSRHRGLTYFMVPLTAEGVLVRGFERLDGDEGFADVFLNDVFVPDDAVLGAVNGGWSVAMATAGSERGLTLRSPGRFLAATERLIELARRYPDRIDGALQERIVSCWLDTRSYQLGTLATVTRMADGEKIGAEASLNKIHWSELDLLIHETALQILGPDAALDSTWTRGFQFALAGPIYAGTNEIQRNIAAERLLGLPRR